MKPAFKCLLASIVIIWVVIDVGLFPVLINLRQEKVEEVIYKGVFKNITEKEAWTAGAILAEFILLNDQYIGSSINIDVNYLESWDLNTLVPSYEIVLNYHHSEYFFEGMWIIFAIIINLTAIILFLISYTELSMMK